MVKLSAWPLKRLCCLAIEFLTQIKVRLNASLLWWAHFVIKDFANVDKRQRKRKRRKMWDKYDKEVARLKYQSCRAFASIFVWNTNDESNDQ